MPRPGNDSITTTTDYLVDQNNPTGYSQVLEESVNGTLDRSYTIGLDVIAQADTANDVLELLYDGHGSTRALASSGSIVQRFAYDAYLVYADKIAPSKGLFPELF